MPTTKSLKYTGKLDSLIFEFKGVNYQVYRSTPFVTEDMALAKHMLEHPQIEEAGKDAKEEKSSSTRKNAAV